MSVLVIRPVKQFSFSDDDGTRMLDDNCVAVLEEKSRWTVLPQRSCEDHIEASLWLEQQDHHAQPSVGDDDQRHQ